MRTLLSVVLVLAMPLFASAQDAPSRERLITMLSGFESTPTLAEMRALGDGAVPVLVSLYDDPTVIQPVRLRAVESMGAYATPAARTFLLRVIHEPGQSPIVVREALEALAQSQGAGAVHDISPLLTSTDRSVREGAVEALGTIHTAAARRQLTRHATHESDTALRARITALTAR